MTSSTRTAIAVEARTNGIGYVVTYSDGSTRINGEGGQTVPSLAEVIELDGWI